MSGTSVLTVAVAAAVIVLILWTMPVGKRIAERLGLPDFRGMRQLGGLGGSRSSRPKQEDRDYLLRVCGGDRAEVERRLAAERERFSDLGEADIYRRAIRTHMKERGVIE